MIKHGLSKHPLYNTWLCIKVRCYCITNKEYPRYGGRGILMSDEFKNDFKAFVEYTTALPNYHERYNGYRTLDRIENDKGYERGNLRWATYQEQRSNRSITMDVMRSFIKKRHYQKQPNNVR